MLAHLQTAVWVQMVLAVVGVDSRRTPTTPNPLVLMALVGGACLQTVMTTQQQTPVLAVALALVILVETAALESALLRIGAHYNGTFCKD
jgi:hypothetical protein